MKKFEYRNQVGVSSLPQTEMKIPLFENEPLVSSNLSDEPETKQNEYALRTNINNFIYGNLAGILSDFSSKARTIQNQKEFAFNPSSPFFTTE
jgi:hypothetical protein